MPPYQERGDRKKAKNHLRVEPLSNMHDFITFRSGLWLGLAMPAIAAGFYLCRTSSKTVRWYHSDLHW